ncbi:calcium-binding protein, partial [Neisseria sp.]|uniref:calcium-binding protein n=1 Tax=Neisseria sp. TaxID=192066 RepID=UPI0026DCC3F1
GSGNDYLSGGSNEADTYVFAKGHGQDTVSDYGTDEKHTDTLKFEGAKFDDAVFTRINNDLIIKAYGEADAVSVSQYFGSYTSRYVQFAFDDKTVKFADVAMNITGTDKDDSLYGWSTVDTVSGGAGNDIIYTGSGNDILLGGEGNDRLYGENDSDVLDGGSGDDELNGGSGSDTLTGGSGNDYLSGGSNEADTYVFAEGHGQDTVSDSGYSDIHIDTLIFEDALLENAVFSREGSNLLVQAYGSEDKVSVQNYFSGSSYRYNQFVFEDATVKVDAAMNVSVI